MTYQEFKHKYNGVGIDYDKHYGNQCWDLAQQYITECLGLPSSILSGAGYVSNMLKEPKLSLLLKYFDEVQTTAMNEGDIVIWDGTKIKHIAIFDHWDGKYCWYFSQNPNAPQVIKINKSGARAFRVINAKPQPKPIEQPIEKPIEPQKPAIKIGQAIAIKKGTRYWANSILAKLGIGGYTLKKDLNVKITRVAGNGCFNVTGDLGWFNPNKI